MDNELQPIRLSKRLWKEIGDCIDCHRGIGIMGDGENAELYFVLCEDHRKESRRENNMDE